MMILRYIIWLIWFNGFLNVANIIEFPKAWIAREYLRENPQRNCIIRYYWGFLHDGCDFGDEYFFEKHGDHETFLTAYKWALRNPLHNLYYSHQITGKKENYSGYATIQKGKADKGLMWRTLKTCDTNGIYKDKHGVWVDYEKSILGKQRIVFEIEGKKYFRYSGCEPKHLTGELWWCMEYKFGFENTNWAIQFKPFKVKKWSGSEIKYDEIIMKN